MDACLPYTGTSVWPMVIAAVILVTIGLVLHQMTRRRQGTSTSMGVIALLVLTAGSFALLATQKPVEAASIDCAQSAVIEDIPAADAIRSLPLAPTAMIPDGSTVPGELLTITQGGFEPFEEVVLLVASKPRLIGRGKANRDGVVTITGQIPQDLAPGNHTLAVWSPTRSVGFAQPIVVTGDVGSTTSISVPPGSSTTTVETTTTVSPTTTISESTTTIAPTTTVPESTTTTIDPGLTPQTVRWDFVADFAVTESPVVMPDAQSVEASWLSRTYSIVSAGSAGCAVDTNTRELSFTSEGTCTVQVSVDPWSNYGPGTAETIVVVGPAPVCDNSLSYQVGDVGPGGGKIFYVSPTCQRWGRFLEIASAGWTGSSDGAATRPLWCDANIHVSGASASGFGRGLANTFAIMRSCADAAANRAQAYRGGGKVDWYLASSDEWREVCKWAHAVAVSNTSCGGYAGYVNDLGFVDHYWTSTTDGNNNPIENWMPGGQDFRSVGKTTDYVSMRPIRAFGLAPSIQASWQSNVTRSTSRTVDFTLDFSEAISGLSSLDITNSGTATGCSFTPASSSGSSIAVQALCGSDGTVIPVLTAESVSGTSVTGPAISTPGSAVPIDSTAPTLEVNASSQTVVVGSAFAVSQNERGSIYIVNDSVTVSSLVDITSAADGEWNVSTVPTVESVVNLNTAGLSTGAYRIYGVDLAGNVSAPDEAQITIRAPQVCSVTCLIGDTGPGGGSVFYAAASPQSWGQYLEFAPSNWSGSSDGSLAPVWCDTSTLIDGAEGTAIGTGYTNTLAMMTGCTSGIAIDANSYRGSGFVDWFVPSEGEQKELCKWVHGIAPSQSSCGGYGGYVNNSGFVSHYWTSTQTGANSAIETWMEGGNDYRNVDKYTNYVSLRPIRAFGGDPSVNASITADQVRSTSLNLGFTIDFSESISGLSSSDLTNVGTATGCVFTPSSSSGTSIDVNAVCAGDGSVIVKLSPGAVQGTSVAGPRVATYSLKVRIDSQAPVLTITAGPTTIVVGGGIEVALNERGSVYLVKDSVTVTDLASITGAADASWNTVYAQDGGTGYVISTAGLSVGNYHLYGVDLAGNLSAQDATTYTLRDSQQCSTSCLVGDIGPGGGIVFYDAGSTQSWGRYLEVAPASWSGSGDGTPMWCDNTDLLIDGANGVAIGTGATNTAAIVAACASGAAVNAAGYLGGGLSDWFLPAEDEQKELCKWVKGVPASRSNCGGYGGYVNNLGFASHYWTSTQTGSSTAMETWMEGGNDYRNVGKSTNYISVRPIRAF
ncbi:MAG: hypothetical protein K9H34_06040 [Actinomycetia bacterium]|nr:hypothetical protein [Actinomycetes bacterium]